jgi:hypothetical protein
MKMVELKVIMLIKINQTQKNNLGLKDNDMNVKRKLLEGGSVSEGRANGESDGWG